MYLGDAWQQHQHSVLLRAQGPSTGLIVVATDGSVPATSTDIEQLSVDLATLDGQGRVLDLMRQRLPLSDVHYALPNVPGRGTEARERFLKLGVLFPTQLVNAVLGLEGACRITLYASSGDGADSHAVNAYWQGWLGAAEAATSHRIDWVLA